MVSLAPSAVLQSQAKIVSEKTLFRLKFTALTIFGTLLIIDSLFLVLCYITFDFFGALNSPFFAWLRDFTLAAKLLYFPAFAAALLSIDHGRKKELYGWIIGVLLVLQILLGMVFIWGPGLVCPFGWTMLFGPNVRTPLANEDTYAEAIACLIPLAWISLIQIGSRIETGVRATARPLKLSPFLLAGITVSLLYTFASQLRLRLAGQPTSLATIAFSVAAHVAIFTTAFAVLEWIGRIAHRFSNPALIQFIARCLVAWGLLALVIRKIIFALLGFNDNWATIFAVLFALCVVLFAASLTLTLKQRVAAETRVNPARQWAMRSAAFAAILALYYIFAIRFVAIDWQHILSSITALLIWVLMLRFFASIGDSARHYSVKFLIPLSLACIAAVAGLRSVGNHQDLADALEQYANYNGSFFAIQQTVKPVLQDEKYAEWYKFLSAHAGIRPPIAAPDVPLSADLKPIQGPRPNIFILVIDALRRDYVSAYNPAVKFTPAMQEFALESIVFKNAYSPYAGTALADPALFSGFQQINKIFPKPLHRVNNLQRMLNVDRYHFYMSYNPIVAELTDESANITGLSTDLNNKQQKEFSTVITELEDDLAKRTDPEHPVFAFTQPANVHTLSLTWRRGEVDIQPHPGFDDAYASAVERVDRIFGGFVAFLKSHQLYDNSIIILTSDHGESLGEMGREGHVSFVTPEVVQIPFIIHLPEKLRAAMVWNTDCVMSLHDITPTLYYLLGHRPIRRGEMIGYPLFTATQEEQTRPQPDHYFFMSSYAPVFGTLSGDRKSLFIVDASLHRNYFYDLDQDPRALKNLVTIPIRDRYEPIIRQDLEKIDSFYNLSEDRLKK